MDVQGSVSRERASRIEAAILVHSQQGGGTQAGFATVHRVHEEEGRRPEVGAGRLLAASELERALAQVVPQRRLVLLPPTLLAFNSSTLVWWRPPAPARVWFRAAQPLGETSGVTPHPGLVFAVTAERAWYVWALAGTDRPRATTPMYVAPYLNVWSGGKICQGSVALPAGVDVDLIPAFEDAFFDSVFTHPNVPKLVSARGGVLALWARLLKRRPKEFPVQYLLDAKVTLAEVIAKLGR
jgi:PRTRC genetic system protein B